MNTMQKFISVVIAVLCFLGFQMEAKATEIVGVVPNDRNPEWSVKHQALKHGIGRKHIKAWMEKTVRSNPLIREGKSYPGSVYKMEWNDKSKQVTYFALRRKKEAFIPRQAFVQKADKVMTEQPAVIHTSALSNVSIAVTLPISWLPLGPKGLIIGQDFQKVAPKQPAGSSEHHVGLPKIPWGFIRNSFIVIGLLLVVRVLIMMLKELGPHVKPDLLGLIKWIFSRRPSFSFSFHSLNGFLPKPRDGLSRFFTNLRENNAPTNSGSFRGGAVAYNSFETTAEEWAEEIDDWWNTHVQPITNALYDHIISWPLYWRALCRICRLFWMANGRKRRQLSKDYWVPALNFCVITYRTVRGGWQRKKIAFDETLKRRALAKEALRVQKAERQLKALPKPESSKAMPPLPKPLPKSVLKKGLNPSQNAKRQLEAKQLRQGRAQKAAERLAEETPAKILVEEPPQAAGPAIVDSIEETKPVEIGVDKKITEVSSPEGRAAEKRRLELIKKIESEGRTAPPYLLRTKV